jgi:rSAM/selenodomain-associated transferase 1
MMANAGLIIFVKAPISGEVKTRLAADVGEEKALQVYSQLLEITKNIALQFDATRIIWSNKKWKANPNYWPNEFFEFHLQNGSNLGEKMANALDYHFKEGYSKLLLIGSDCPEINHAILEEALAALDSFDIVLGPAKDGGYYLIAMKKIHEALFEDKQWSNDQVLAQTIKRAKAKNLSYHLLQTLSDIDNVTDLILLPNEPRSTNN